MVNKKRVVIITELFYPEESATANILTSIAKNLNDSFDVLVLTGPKTYEKDENRLGASDEELKVEVQRVWAPNLNKNRVVSRVIRFMVLSAGLGFRAFAVSRKADVVFSVTNPAPILVVLGLVRKLKKFTLAFLVHDVFPENAVAAGVVSEKTLFYPLIKRTFDWAYGTADAVVVIGRDMAEIVSRKIRKHDKNIALIENWADTSLVTPMPRSDSNIDRWGLSDKVVIQYAGNIGRAQSILEFVDAITSIENSAVHYVFCGSGALTNQLQERVRDWPNFSLKGGYPRSGQALILGSCDVSLIILGPNMYGLGVPSKTYNIMAAGKPILFIGPRDSEIYRLVRENNIGWAFDWHEMNEMIALINSFSLAQIGSFSEMGKRARLLAEKSYSESMQINRFRRFFGSLHDL